MSFITLYGECLRQRRSLRVLLPPGGPLCQSHIGAHRTIKGQRFSLFLSAIPPPPLTTITTLFSHLTPPLVALSSLRGTDPSYHCLLLVLWKLGVPQDTRHDRLKHDAIKFIGMSLSCSLLLLLSMFNDGSIGTIAFKHDIKSTLDFLATLASRTLATPFRDLWHWLVCGFVVLVDVWFLGSISLLLLVLLLVLLLAAFLLCLFLRALLFFLLALMSLLPRSFCLSHLSLYCFALFFGYHTVALVHLGDILRLYLAVMMYSVGASDHSSFSSHDQHPTHTKFKDKGRSCKRWGRQRWGMDRL